MKFNVSKSKVMYVGTKNTPNITYTSVGSNLEVTDQQKYFGVVVFSISEKGKLNDQYCKAST